jgi:hypothetical protein
MQTVNIDAPPKGPIRWRWVTSAFASLLRAAGIISPDESVNIDATTGGFTLAQKKQTINQIKIKSVGYNLFEVPELSVIIGFSVFTVEKKSISVPDGHLLCAKIDYTLNTTAMDKTAIYSSGIFSSDIDWITVTLASIPVGNIADARAAIPGSFSNGIIYLPLAINDGGFTILATGATFQVTIYHGAFKFRVFR